MGTLLLKRLLNFSSWNKYRKIVFTTLFWLTLWDEKNMISLYQTDTHNKEE